MTGGLIGCAIGLSSGDVHAQPTIHVSAPTLIADAAEMDQDGLLFPDSLLSFVPTEGGRVVAFASGGSVRGIGPGPATTPSGTYQFVGTFDHLSPVLRDGRPARALSKGDVQPSPDGGDFDRDYAGGGQVVSLGPSTLLAIYHGEHRCDPSVGIPAFGGSGMAVSRDGGKSFRKIGQILAPGVSRDDFCASGRHAGFWTDGVIVEGDADGGHADSTYDYILFVDHNATDEPFIAISIARARKTDVLAAVAAGKAPTFMKYYNPNHAAGPTGQFFTEPGNGGRSTPVVVTPNIAIGGPAVSYDAREKLFVATYQQNQKSIAVSFASNLFRWSPPTEIVKLDTDSDMRLFYPSPVSVDGDPSDLGMEFYVYYLQRRPRNTEPRLLRITVDLR